MDGRAEFCTLATLADLDFPRFSLRTLISPGERLPRSFMRDPSPRMTITSTFLTSRTVCRYVFHRLRESRPLTDVKPNLSTTTSRSEVSLIS